MTEIPQTPSADAIRATREHFNKAIAEHQAASIQGFLAPNYHIVTGRSDQFHGAEEEAIRWAQVFESDPSVVYVRTPREIRVNEAWGLAEELGDWKGSYTLNNQSIRASGVYAAKWQRAENGKWLIQAEVFTTLEWDGPALKPDPVI